MVIGTLGVLIILISYFFGNTPSGSVKRKIWIIILASPAISYFVVLPLLNFLIGPMSIHEFILFGFLISILLVTYLVVIGKSIE